MRRLISMRSARHSQKRWSHLSATAGGIAWLLLFLPLNQETQALIGRLLLFAILVVTPLALALVVPPGLRWWARLYQIVCVYQPVAALLTVVAFALPAGLLAALLGASWLLLTGLVAL